MVANLQSPSTQIESRAALENIAHLTRKICGIWGSPELDVFLSQLIMDARDGARQGLPVGVAEELLFLAQTNKMLRAIDLAKKLSVGIAEAYRRIDEGDQARLTIDPLDDPTVSGDTIVSRTNRSTEAPERHAAPRSSGSQAQGLRELLLLLIHSKWVLGAIVLYLCVKFVWPMVKPLI